jgi:hypothetical protein
MSENICTQKTEEVTEGSRKIHNEELPRQILLERSNKGRWAGNVTRMAEKCIQHADRKT